MVEEVEKRFYRRSWPDGSFYEGQLTEIARHGIGIHVWPGGQAYIGEFSRDKREGVGLYLWLNSGDIFVGNFAMNERYGPGIYFSARHTYVFQGNYRENMRSGAGVVTYSSGEQDAGSWRDENLIKLEYAVVNQLVDCWHDDGSSKSTCSGCVVARGTLLVCTQLKGILDRLRLSVDQQVAVQKVAKKCVKTLTHLVSAIALCGCEGLVKPPRPTQLGQLFEKLAKCTARNAIEALPNVTVNPAVSSEAGKDSILTALQCCERQTADGFTCKHGFGYVPLKKLINKEVVESLMIYRKRHHPPGLVEKSSVWLMWLAASGNVDDICELRRAVHLPNDVTDVHGCSPILLAAVHGHVNTVISLLNNGANVNILTDSGMSCLSVCYHLAYCIHGNRAQSPARIPKHSSHDCGRQSVSWNLPPEEGQHSATKIDSTSQEMPSDKVEPFQETKEDSHMSACLSLERPSSEGMHSLANSTEDNEELVSHGCGQDSPSSFCDEELPSLSDLSDSPDNSRAVAVETCSSISKYLPSVMSRLSTYATSIQPPALAELSYVEKLRTVISALLQYGGDVNLAHRPEPPIFCTVRAQDMVEFRSLLSRGASVDLSLFPQDGGTTALHEAVSLKGKLSVRLVDILISSGAAVDQASSAQASDQCEAGTDNQCEVISDSRSLSKHLAPLAPVRMNVQCGWTPLHVTAHKDCDHQNAYQAARLLLAHGADPNRLTASGESPLSLAIKSGNDQLVDTLLKAGADPNLPLGPDVKSALCAVVSLKALARRKPATSCRLAERLMQKGADVMASVVVIPNQPPGTVVDYAFHIFLQHENLSKKSYTLLTNDERKLYVASKRVRSYLAKKLRYASRLLLVKHLEQLKEEAECRDHIDNVLKQLVDGEDGDDNLSVSTESLGSVHASHANLDDPPWCTEGVREAMITASDTNLRYGLTMYKFNQLPKEGLSHARLFSATNLFSHLSEQGRLRGRHQAPNKPSKTSVFSSPLEVPSYTNDYLLDSLVHSCRRSSLSTGSTPRISRVASGGPSHVISPPLRYTCTPKSMASPETRTRHSSGAHSETSSIPRPSPFLQIPRDSSFTKHNHGNQQKSQSSDLYQLPTGNFLSVPQQLGTSCQERALSRRSVSSPSVVSQEMSVESSETADSFIDAIPLSLESPKTTSKGSQSGSDKITAGKQQVTVKVDATSPNWLLPDRMSGTTSAIVSRKSLTNRSLRPATAPAFSDTHTNLHRAKSEHWASSQMNFQERVLSLSQFRHCYSCGRSIVVRLFRCKRCHLVDYCSRQCKQTGWVEGHREECFDANALGREKESRRRSRTASPAVSFSRPSAEEKKPSPVPKGGFGKLTWKAQTLASRQSNMKHRTL